MSKEDVLIGDKWSCKKSPDHVCHYFSDNDGNVNYVVLADGRLFELHQHYENKFENEDSCIFCKQPEERK